MAKRFIDTDLFKKQFIRGIQGAYKLLWVYVITDCNHAGIWECDFEIASIRLGQKLNKERAIEIFGDKIIQIDNGEKWFIPSFIEFQYGELSETNRAHNGVISLLKRYGLLTEELKIYAPYKPLTSPLQGDKDKDKEKDKEKDKDKEGGVGEKISCIVLPFQTERFSLAWSNWRQFRMSIKKPYTSIHSEQMALKKLSEYDEEFSIKLIETSMSNGWQGLVFDKTDLEYARYKQSSSRNPTKFGEEIASLIGQRGY